MKLNHLTLQAFGPFADRQTIDFDKLSEDAVFMISGPTGAGKTSILDAIAYAFYGETSGGERDPREMRSHHADPATFTKVELGFELGGARYLIKRSPEQIRPAKKAGGRDTVEAPKTAELHIQDGSEWKLKTSKPKEVDQALAQLIGFEAEQFRQVIMLPQGMFREVLTAESGTRERILETLFSTEKYKRLQARLNDSCRDLDRQAKELRHIDGVLLGSTGLESQDALKQRIEETRVQMEDMGRQEVALRQQSQTAEKALADANLLTSKFLERDLAKQELSRLDADSAKIATMRSELETAQRALRVEPVHARLKEVNAQHQQVIKTATEAKLQADQSARALNNASSAHQTEEAKEPLRDAALKERLRLEEMRGVASKLKEAQQTSEQAEKRFAAASHHLSALEKGQAKAEQDRTALQAGMDKLRPVAAQQESLGLKIEQQKKLHGSIGAFDAAKKNLVHAQQHEDKLKQDGLTAKEEQERLQARLDALNADWRAGQASRLAGHLHNGEPCPVCGSVEHPQPATSDVVVPSDEDLQAAENALRAAGQKLDKLRVDWQDANSKRVAIETEIKTIQDSLPPGAVSSIDAVADALRKLQKELNDANTAAGELKKSEAAISALNTDITKRGEQIVAARTEASAAQAAKAAAASVCEQIAQNLPEAFRQGESLEQAITEAKAEETRLNEAWRLAQDALRKAQTEVATHAERVRNAEGSIKELTARLANARAELIDALQTANFESEAVFLAALRPVSDMDDLGRKMKEYDESMASAKERLARALKAVEGLELPDLEKLKAENGRLRETLEAMIRQQMALNGQLQTDEQTVAKLSANAAELKKIEHRYGVLGRLAEIANGKAGRRITFQRFVLASLLDDVLRQASLRLKAMTAGRYELKRDKEVTDARLITGLDLNVYDDHTGMERTAKTLSGGEGFMAALSLALGLSDVVQSYSGGIQLDTLFIDEGFGSLDAESLDQAMKSIVDLKQQGRRVGIISHVEELKRQIGVGIEVKGTLKGSTVSVI